MKMRTYSKIFGDQDFGEYSAERLNALKAAIAAESPEYLVNVNEDEYIGHLCSKFSIEPLVLHYDALEASSEEELIPAERFPSNYNVVRGKSYPKPVIWYHLPVSGELALLHCMPNPRVHDFPGVEVSGRSISWGTIDFDNSADNVKRALEGILATIKQQAGYLSANVAGFNNSLEEQARTIFRARKEEHVKRTGVLASLGVPIRQSQNVPRTFAVPAKRVPVIPRPTGAAAASPDPTLDETIYQAILNTINDMGKVFERLPSTYADKDVESLRDHLIMQLEPRFEYSTTGETFNKQGKTDILIRHQKSNLFVAECKFWGGQKKHHETIDQIESYLTWRDSKTAIVYFVDTKEMVAPLKAIQESTASHPCFVKDNGKRGDAWFDYTFHLPSDPNVLIRVSILCFHLPKPS